MNARGDNSPLKKRKALATHKRSSFFLAAGLLCYSLAWALSIFQQDNADQDSPATIIAPVGLLADYLWSLPSLLVMLCAVLVIPWLYFSLKVKDKASGYFNWLFNSPFASLMKILAPLLLFTYSIFPLRWAQLSFSRSPDSFPEYTPLSAAIIISIVSGTILLCLCCFEKLPLRITALTEKITARFFQWKESYFIGSLLPLCFAITGTIAFVVLNHIPHVQDSIAQLFHAKIFAMGKVTAPLPICKEFFDFMFIINDVRWYSQYPPGHSLLLMVGLLLKTPWLVGPVLSTLSLFIFYYLVKEVYGDNKTAYLCALLLLCSPFFLFMSASHMNHTSTLFCMLIFLYSYKRIFSSRSVTFALVAGLSLGYAITIRPLTAVAVGFPFTCNLLWHAYRKKELQTNKVIVFLVGVSLLISLLLAFNSLTTGNPFVFGYQQKHSTLGFVGNAQEGPPHSLKGGMINTSNNLIGLNQHLFGWPVPSLIFVFILFTTSLRKNRWDYLFLCASLALMGSYFFYYYQDYCYGPRFYYSLTPFMIMLTVRGFSALVHWSEKKGFIRRKVEATLYLFLLTCLLYMFSFSFPQLVKKYSNDYWWVTDKLHNAVQKQGLANAVVFVDCWYPPDVSQPNLLYYGSGFQFNSPDLNDEVIYALDLKEKNSELMEAFPERSFYYYNYFLDPTRVDEVSDLQAEKHPK
jgi:4-amino-4-deoxy-L-arabinose transferase-like glycosyltransferase